MQTRSAAAQGPTCAADTQQQTARAGGVKEAPGVQGVNLKPPSTTADAELLAEIRDVISSRATYRYRRTAAIIRRRRRNAGRPAVNHKRVYRLMRHNELLLRRHFGDRPGRTHDGKVITLKSDLRWCSDTFEVQTWNGDRVQVAFVLDCCDREVIAFTAVHGFIDGQMIRDMMLAAVEHRFGQNARALPHAIEWLSDNGSVYTAHETVDQAEALGEMSGKRKVWRLMPTARRQAIPLTTAQMVALFLSRRVFDFLAGTGFKEDLDDVFEKLEATLKRKDFVAVRNLDRKVFDVNEARHLYEGRIEDVNDIMTALLREDRLRVTHEGVSGGRKTFVLEPYTLLVYKKGLYLAGRSTGHGGEVRTFALDGFREVEWLKGDHFEYPADFRPEQLTEGAFGLIGGEPTSVRLLFDPKVARYVQRRQWHPTQHFRRTARGEVEMTMEVRGTVEVTSWVLGFGDKAVVVEPAALRDSLADELARAAERYGR